MLTGFTAIFMASGFALIGNQHLEVLGFEWLGLWIIATIIFIRGVCYSAQIGGEFYWIECAKAYGRDGMLSR